MSVQSACDEQGDQKLSITHGKASDSHGNIQEELFITKDNEQRKKLKFMETERGGKKTFSSVSHQQLDYFHL